LVNDVFLCACNFWVYKHPNNRNVMQP
jgi:hypothetical protein